MRDRLYLTFKIVYCILLFVLPIVSVVFVVRQADVLGVSEGEINFLFSSFFLVALFNLFFLILYHGYLPTRLGGITSLLFAPIVSCLIQLVLARQFVSGYLAELGMIYTIEVVLAFCMLMGIIVVAGLWTSIVERDKAGASILLLCVLQLLFLIPGGGAVYIFSKVIFTVFLPAAIDPYEPISVMGILVYIVFFAPILQNLWTFFKAWKEESIIA